MASRSIEDLPDDVLSRILSFLPTTKQRAATSLLSRRWRHLWTHVPSLDFRVVDFPNDSAYGDDVHECLRRISGPLHRFSADLPFDPHDHRKAYLTLDRWMRILSTTSLRELSLHAGSEDPCLVLSESVLSLAPSLRALKLYTWDLTEFHWARNPHWRGFERLHTLVLDNVAIFDDQLCAALAACPFIENLKIYSSQLSINLSSSVNPRLKIVDLDGDIDRVEDAVPFQVIIDLADLEMLMLAGDTMWDLRLSASPKLREVGLFPFTACEMPANLSGVEIMSANASVFHVEYEKRQEFAFPNLKVLFASGVPEYGSLLPFVSFLSRCPSLDTLHVSIFYQSQSDYEDVEFDKLDAGPTSSCRVKTVTVMDVTGHKRDKALMKYLLGKMTCLQSLSIVFSQWNRSIIRKEEQLLEEVRLFARISPVVDIIVQTRNNISLPDSSYEWFGF